MSVTSKRPPYPYDALISDVGVMCATDDHGNVLVGKKVQPLGNVVPNSAEYGNEDLYRERSFAFKRPVLGMGERVQATPYSPRYRYALNCWFAGGLRGKGPLWHNLAPASTGEIRAFPEALNGGVLTQFILAGRYCLIRGGDTSGTQTVSKDFGVGRQAQAAVRWKNAGAGIVDGLFVALDNKELWRYDGAAWLQMGTSVTIPAQYLATVGDELWKGRDNFVSKCTGDPTVAGNWAAEITVGDASSLITALVNVNNTLLIFKDNGKAYTVNGDGTDNDLLPGQEWTVASTNGRNAATWLDTNAGTPAAFFRQGDSFWRLTLEDGAALRQIGPERMGENDSEVSGIVTCLAGNGDWYALMGLYNSQNGNSYLLQLGDWLPPDASSGDERYRFAEVINGALLKWTTRQVTAIRVSSLVSGNPRCYCGFADGTFGYFLLPKNTPNPFASTSGCEFADGTLGASQCYWPVHTMMAPGDNKNYLSLAGYGPVMDSSTYAQIDYRTDTGASYSTLSPNLTTPGVRVDLPDNTAGRQIDVRETYVSASSASTPVIESVVLREQLRPSLRMEYTLVVKARHRVAKHDGSTDRKTAEQIQNIVRAAADAPGSVSLTLPDEVTQGFSSVDYGELVPARNRRYGMAWDLPVSFVQYRTNTTYGTVDRLGPYTVDDLGPLTVDQLGVL